MQVVIVLIHIDISLKPALHLSLFTKSSLTWIFVADIDKKQWTRKTNMNIDSHLHLFGIIHWNECINIEKKVSPRFVLHSKYHVLTDNTRMYMPIITEYGEHPWMPLHTHHVRYLFAAIGVLTDTRAR